MTQIADEKPQKCDSRERADLLFVQDFDLDYDVGTLDFGGWAGTGETDIASSWCEPRKYRRPQCVRYEYAEEMAVAMPSLNDDGDSVFGIVSGNFIFGDFLEALMVRRNYHASEIMVATLSMSQNNADSLANIINGDYTDSLSLVVSDYWYAHERRRNGGVPYIMDTLGKSPGFRFAAGGLHTKIILVKTSCGKHLVMHGSANLRSSRNVEQVCIENSATLYEFNCKWLAAILDRFELSRKTERASRLWTTLTEQCAEND